MSYARQTLNRNKLFIVDHESDNLCNDLVFVLLTSKKEFHWMVTYQLSRCLSLSLDFFFFLLFLCFFERWLSGLVYFSLHL